MCLTIIIYPPPWRCVADIGVCDPALPAKKITDLFDLSVNYWEFILRFSCLIARITSLTLTQDFPHIDNVLKCTACDVLLSQLVCHATYFRDKSFQDVCYTISDQWCTRVIWLGFLLKPLISEWVACQRCPTASEKVPLYRWAHANLRTAYHATITGVCFWLFLPMIFSL